MNYFLPLAAAVILSGCAANRQFLVENEPQYDPAKHARLRVNDNMTLYFGTACEESVFMLTGYAKLIKSEGKSLYVPATGWFYKSKILGMPMTSKKSAEATTFHELVIPKDKPLSLSAIYAQGRMTCGPLSGKFVPKAGKNYEASFYLNGGWDRCILEVKEIISQADEIKTVPVTLQPLETTSSSRPNPRCNFADQPNQGTN